MASKFLVKLSISLSIALPNLESKEKSIRVPTLSWLACGDSVIDLEARTNFSFNWNFWQSLALYRQKLDEMLN